MEVQLAILALFLEVGFCRHLQSIRAQRRGRGGQNIERGWADEEGEQKHRVQTLSSDPSP